MKPLILSTLAAALALAPVFAHADPCLPGFFSNDGQDPCTPCSAGTYSSSAGATGCTECDPHTYAAAPGWSACEECGPDLYQPEAGSADCVWRNRLNCWTVRDFRNPAAFNPMLDVTASDEISTDPVNLTRPSAVCAPATIESLPLGNPDPTMCCYKATRAKPATPVTIETTSVLGGTLQLRVASRALVCDQCQGSAETEQTVQCWKVRDLRNPKFSTIESLRVIDRYSYDFPIVKKPELFCSPASIGGSPLTDTHAQQCCYRVGKAFLSGISESVIDPLGAPLELGLSRRSMVCEPCVATALP
jgi:hypothetical protein